MTSPPSRLLALAPLLLYFVLVTSIAGATSITVDEGLHIASGYTILRTGDYRLVEEHPPAVKLWLAVPLLALHDLDNPTMLPAWTEAAYPTTESLPLLHMAQQLLYPYRPTEHWLFPARAMEALLGVLLLATITRWTDDLWGTRGAILAALFAALDPNLLAHGAVAGTDLGTTALIALAFFATQRFLTRPTPRRAALTGILLGLALTAKLTALLLGPVVVIAGLLRLFQIHGKTRRRLLQLSLLATGLMLLTFWAVYGFQVGNVPGVPFPIPAAAHATPILRLAEHSAGGHQAYLLGENSMHGWWWYFPAAFVLKTPLPVLILALWSLLNSVAKIQNPKLVVSEANPSKIQNLTLWLFPLLYFTASLFSPLNIGYRHLLPVLPFLYIGIGRMVNGEWANGRILHLASCILHPASCIQLPASSFQHHKSRFTFYALRFTLYVLLAWHLIATLSVYPHPLTFFNAIAGGPRNGWRFLADSNTDWGQAYKALARFQDNTPLPPVHLSAFIFYDPALYGVGYDPLTPLRGDTPAVFPSRFAPPPGDYVISATPLDGIPLADPEMYDWFRWRAPDAQIANALHYYHVTAAERAVAWIAQCTTPLPPLSDAALAEGFGHADIRRVDFDCSQSWVIPDGNATPGRYIVHGALLRDTLRARLHLAPPHALDPLIARHLGDTHISYRQRAYRADPAFAIYATAPGTVTLPAFTAWTATAATPPAALQTRPQHTGPIALDGPLAFVGARTMQITQTLTVETWWIVTGDAPTRPLSVMGHLLTASGEVKSIADGLGVPVSTWQRGDIIMQRHTFPLSRDDASRTYILRTGIYWLDDGTRWYIKASDADAIFVALKVIP